MPITAWFCRGCGGREVPLDHFATTRCGETVCHPDYAAAVLADRANQPTGKVRVSHGLGCPRRAGIEQAEDYAVDPLDLLASMSGVAWHLLMEKAAKGAAEIPVTLEVDGITIVGTTDRPHVLPSGEEIGGDWKTTSEYQLGKKAEAGIEHRIQLTMYGKARGWAKAIVWYKSHKEIRPMSVELVPMDEALAHHPYDGEYTVLELYHQADDLMSGRKKWQDLPLTGQSQKFGRKTACDYCSVREACTVAAMGSPWG